MPGDNGSGDNNRGPWSLTTGLVLGSSAGVVLGVIFDNIPRGMIIGMSIGLVLGIALGGFRW